MTKTCFAHILLKVNHGIIKQLVTDCCVVQAAKRGVPVAEVNLDTSDASDICQFVFQVGP